MSLLGSLIETGYQAINNERDRDYQKALQEEIFAREDTAVQRRMADLKAAGLNPNLAAGSAAGAGSVVGRSNTPGIGLGSVLDDLQARNQLKLQKQETENAKATGEILNIEKTKKEQEKSVFEMELLHSLGFAVSPFMQNNKLGYYYGEDPNTTYINPNGYNPKGINQLFKTLDYQFNYNKNAADLLQKDADWYTADKISGMALGLLGLGNSASGFKKAFGK